MSNFNEFQRAAKAAIRVALQWFFLAIPTGLICGLVGTLFHLSVERVTELRADQPWLLFLLPAAGLLITAYIRQRSARAWAPTTSSARCRAASR